MTFQQTVLSSHVSDRSIDEWLEYLLIEKLNRIKRSHESDTLGTLTMAALRHDEMTQIRIESLLSHLQNREIRLLRSGDESST